MGKLTIRLVDHTTVVSLSERSFLTVSAKNRNVVVLLGFLVCWIGLLASPAASQTGGAGFVCPANWTGIGFYGQKATAFADVTGDGMADAIGVNDDGVWVRRSTGAGFSANERWTSIEDQSNKRGTHDVAK